MKNKIITKIRFFANLEKELEFINKMNSLGYKLIFVQFGIFYKFKKVSYSDGFTIIYATDKTKISDISAAALLGGYDIINHTFDGMGNFLYLTGRRCKADEDFVSDNEGKLTYYNSLKSYYRFSAILSLLAFAGCSMPLFVSLSRIIFILQNYENLMNNKIPTVFAIAIILIMFFAGIAFLCASVYLFILYHKAHRNCRKIILDMNLYE
ncbi:MAG: DUF2812 domain-containing protein [Clostridia bacterium]|nr:DUF2812 domain-containing protein [Clostridia bacterium]